MKIRVRVRGLCVLCVVGLLLVVVSLGLSESPKELLRMRAVVSISDQAIYCR
jgi:hypothetical protein